MAVEPTRWGVIYNPKAGSRKAQKRWKEIRGYMESRGVLFDYVQSEGFELLGYKSLPWLSHDCHRGW